MFEEIYILVSMTSGAEDGASFCWNVGFGMVSGFIFGSMGLTDVCDHVVEYLEHVRRAVITSEDICPLYAREFTSDGVPVGTVEV